MIEDNAWTPLAAYDGYEITRWGDVRSVDRVVVYRDSRVARFRGRILKPKRQKSGHLRVNLKRADGRREERFVHQLVLETFVGPRPPGKETRHLNDVPNENIVENLAWGTSSENALDRWRNGCYAK